jgi:hypothetical protein
MADLRTARRTAEQLARDALGGTLLGAAGELGVALAQRAEAAGTIAAAAERAREIVRAAEAEAAAVVDRAPPGSHRGRHRLRGRLAGGHHRRLGSGPAARHGLPQAGHTAPARGRPGTGRAGTRRRALAAAAGA